MTKIQKITAAEAKKVGQTQRYGVMASGLTGIWGEGSTIDEACKTAVATIREMHNPRELTTAEINDDGTERLVEKSDDELLDGTWLTEIVGE